MYKFLILKFLISNRKCSKYPSLRKDGSNNFETVLRVATYLYQQ